MSLREEITVMVRAALVIAVLFAAVGCRDRSGTKGAVIERPGKPPVHGIPGDDAAMNAAIGKARATVDQFVVALEKPKASQKFFSIKMRVSEAGRAEHMWLDDVSFDGTQFHGTLANVPLRLKGVRHGDRLSAAKSEISDWKYEEAGRLRGGFTLRVLRERMSPKEREAFDSKLPFKID